RGPGVHRRHRNAGHGLEWRRPRVDAGNAAVLVRGHRAHHEGGRARVQCLLLARAGEPGADPGRLQDHVREAGRLTSSRWLAGQQAADVLLHRLDPQVDLVLAILALQDAYRHRHAIDDPGDGFLVAVAVRHLGRRVRLAADRDLVLADDLVGHRLDPPVVDHAVLERLARLDVA